MKTSLNIRCKLSEKYIKINTLKQNPDRLGWIVKQAQNSECWMVIWDGTKTIQTYHKSYIDIVE